MNASAAWGPTLPPTPPQAHNGDVERAREALAELSSQAAPQHSRAQLLVGGKPVCTKCAWNDLPPGAAGGALASQHCRCACV